jgi:hypothetical protein
MSKRLFFALAFLVGCASAPNNIPLVWKPERQHSAAPGTAPVDFFKSKIKVEPMTDSRENPKLIGENREDPEPKPATTSDDVAAFVTDHFKSLLSAAGMTVVDSGESAIIKGDIQRFFVTETSKYSGEVRIDIVVTDPTGKTLWEGTTGGTSIRAGFSYRAENYYESLSDALTIATNGLLREPGFEAAIARTR